MNKLEHPCAETGAAVSAGDLDCFDAGLLSDYGGGNVDWWWDYIRSLLGSAHEFYAAQASPPPPSSHDGLREDGLRVPAFAETGPLPSRLDAQHSDGKED